MKKLTGIIICLLLIFENVSAFAQGDFYSEKVCTLVFGETSQSGYSAYKWLDENGREVSIDTDESGERSFGRRNVLPTQYNSSNYGFVTEVKDQGITGSCWAFSVMSAAESNMLKKSDDPATDADLFDFSEAHHVWFAHNSLVNNSADPTSGDGISVSSPYQSGGNWMRSTFALARGMGFAYESDYPYSPYNDDAMGNYDESARYISEYRLVDSFTIPDTNTQAIKEAIMEKGSVTAAFYMTGSYLTYSVGNYCYYCPNEYGTNHQIAIVGWDDNYSADNFKKSAPDSNGAWIAKNSYGDTWGNDGYFYLSYCDKSLTNFHALDVKDGDDFEKVYQYDGYGYSQGLSATSSEGDMIETASFGNVFKAGENESLDRVSFYAVTPDVEYTVDVYTSLPENYATPTNNGTHVLTQSGTVEFSGYYTIDLDEAVSLKKDEYFSVVITVNCDSGAYIPVEGQSGHNDGSYVRYYNSSLNQSFYRFGTSSSWQDASSKGYNNVCVKAFASTPDTVKIGTPAELVEFASSVNDAKTYKGKTVILTSDIDMAGVEFAPIGTEEHPFDGTFDGNGKVISNLTVSSQNNAGLFGVTGKNSTVKLVGLENVSVAGEENVGALIGKSLSKKVYNCYCDGNVTGEEYVGGLIGFNTSGVVDNCFSFALVNAQSTYGSFAGYSASEYVNCYTRAIILPTGNDVQNDELHVTITSNFENGFVAYMLESTGIIWTQGESHPVFSTDPDDEMHLASVYVVTLSEFTSIYLTKKDSLKGLLEEKYEGYSCKVYTDYACQNEFSDAVTFNRTLFAKLELGQLVLADGSGYSISDGLLYGVKQGTTADELLQQFKNTDVLIDDINGDPLSSYDTVTTGCRVYITNASGEVIDEVLIVIYADLNSDGFVDAFDMSVLSSVVNFETEFEPDSAFEKAGDLNFDGFIDAFDLSVMSAIVNFEIEL